MSKLVRAENPDNGRRFTTSEAYAKRKGLSYTEKGATDRFGRLRRDVQRTDKAGQPINASMTREDLEAAAAAAGIPAEDIAAAKNKGQLVSAIKSVTPADQASTFTDPDEPADLDRAADPTTTDTEPATGSDSTTEA